MDGILKRTKVFAQTVHEKNRKDVIVSEGTHGDDAVPERAEFGKGVTEGRIIGEVYLKAFE